MLSLACFTALPSVLISDTSSASFSSKDWQVSSPSRYYLLSRIFSQPTYASLEDVLQEAAKAWALGALASLGSSGFPSTYRITDLSRGLLLSCRPSGLPDTNPEQERSTKTACEQKRSHFSHFQKEKEFLVALLFPRLRSWVPSSDQSRLEALPSPKEHEKSRSGSSFWVTGGW